MAAADTDDEKTGGGESAAAPAAKPAEPKDARPSAIHDVNVDVYAVLGRATMLVSQLLKVGRGAIIELDQRTTDPVDIQVNQELIARGEIVTVDDKLGVTITEVIKKAGS